METLCSLKPVPTRRIVANHRGFSLHSTIDNFVHSTGSGKTIEDFHQKPLLKFSILRLRHDLTDPLVYMSSRSSLHMSPGSFLLKRHLQLSCRIPLISSFPSAGSAHAPTDPLVYMSSRSSLDGASEPHMPALSF